MEEEGDFVGEETSTPYLSLVSGNKGKCKQISFMSAKILIRARKCSDFLLYLNCNFNSIKYENRDRN